MKKTLEILLIALFFMGCGKTEEYYKDKNMNIIKFRDLTYLDTNLTDEVLPIWDINTGYNKDDIVRYENRLYRARENIGSKPDILFYTDSNDGYLNIEIITNLGALANSFPKPPNNYSISGTGETTSSGDQYTKFLALSISDSTHGLITRYSNSLGMSDITVDYITNPYSIVVYNKNNNKYYSAPSNGKYLISDNGFSLSPAPYDDGEGHSISWNLWIEESSYDINRYDILDLLKWEDLGYANKYKCLDNSLSSQTENNGDIVMSFNESKVDSIYFLNIEAKSVNVKVWDYDTNTFIFDETKDLWDLFAVDWYEYYYGEPSLKNKINFNLDFDLNIAFNTRIDIIIYAENGIAKIGTVGIGRKRHIGDALYGASNDIIDYSIKETNANGETYFKEGNYKNKVNIPVRFDTDTYDYIREYLNSLRATPAMYQSSDKFSSLQIFGLYKASPLTMTNPIKSQLNLQIESLI